jgi:hypothetical protein
MRGRGPCLSHAPQSGSIAESYPVELRPRADSCPLYSAISALIVNGGRGLRGPIRIAVAVVG